MCDVDRMQRPPRGVKITAHAVAGAGEQTRTETVDSRDSYAVTAPLPTCRPLLARRRGAPHDGTIAGGALLKTYLDWATHLNESQVAFLEDMMWEQGFLDATQMAGAFQMLHSSDLVWSRMVRDYLMGERAPMIDLMAWNADATRMPYRMHSEYLRNFLNNDLAEGISSPTSRSRSRIFAPRSSRSAPCATTSRRGVPPTRSIF